MAVKRALKWHQAVTGAPPYQLCDTLSMYADDKALLDAPRNGLAQAPLRQLPAVLCAFAHVPQAHYGHLVPTVSGSQQHPVSSCMLPSIIVLPS